MKTPRKGYKSVMNSYWAGKIKVVNAALMCCAVDPNTLEAVSCSVYDPYAWKDREIGPIETISTAEWYRRRAQKTT